MGNRARVTLGPALTDEVVAATDQPVRVRRNLQTVFDHGRLAAHLYNHSTVA